jgi:hypothetical protein
VLIPKARFNDESGLRYFTGFARHRWRVKEKKDE